MDIDVISKIREAIKGDRDSYLAKFQKFRDKLLDDYASNESQFIDAVDHFSALYSDTSSLEAVTNSPNYDDLKSLAQWMIEKQNGGEYVNIATSHGAYRITSRFIPALQAYQIDIGPQNSYQVLAIVYDTTNKVVIPYKYYDAISAMTNTGVIDDTSIEELISSIPSSATSELAISRIADAIQSAWQSSMSRQSGYVFDASSEDTNALSLAIQNQRSSFVDSVKLAFDRINGFDDLKSYLLEAAPYGLPALWATLTNYVENCKTTADEQDQAGIELSSTEIELNSFGTGMVLSAVGELLTSIGTVLLAITKIGAAIALASGLALQVISKVSAIADKNYRGTKFTVDSNGELAFSFVLDQVRGHYGDDLYDYIESLDTKIASFKDLETPVIYYVYISETYEGVSGRFLDIEAHLSANYDISGLFKLIKTTHIIGMDTDDHVPIYQMMVVPDLINGLSFWQPYQFQHDFLNNYEIYPLIWTNFCGLYHRYTQLSGDFIAVQAMFTHGGDSGFLFRYAGDKDLGTDDILPSAQRFMDYSENGLDINAISQYGNLFSEELESVLRVRLLSGMFILAWYFIKPLVTGIANGNLTGSAEYANTRWIGWRNTNGYINSSDADWYQPNGIAGCIQDWLCWINALPVLFFTGSAGQSTLFIHYLEDQCHYEPFIDSYSGDGIIGLIASQFNCMDMWDRKLTFNPNSSSDRNDVTYGYTRFALSNPEFTWSEGTSQSHLKQIVNEWDGTNAVSMIRMGTSGWLGPLDRVMRSRLTYLFASRHTFSYSYRGQPSSFAFSLPTLTFKGYMDGLIVDGILAIAIVGLAVGAAVITMKARKAIARKSTDVTAYWYDYQNKVSSGASKADQDAAWAKYTRSRFKYNILALLTGSDKLTLTAGTVNNDSLSVFNAVRSAASKEESSIGASNDQASMDNDSTIQAKLRFLSEKLDQVINLISGNI